MKSMTEGKPIKLIILFTIPLLLGNLFQQFYNLVDTLIVGQTLGVNALASVGACSSVIFLVIGFAFGITSGLSIPTAQKFGAKDYKGVRKSIVVNITLVLFIGLLLMLVAGNSVRFILESMQTPPDLIDASTRFLRVIMFGIPITMLYNMMSNLLRALGDSKTPLMFLIISSIMNIGLDYLFILSFHMHVEGAAYATVISSLFSFICCMMYVWFKFPVFHLTKEDFKLCRSDIYDHLKIAFPMGFQMSIIAIGAILVQVALNQLGPQAVAAYTVSGRIDQLTVQPILSFGIAMTTYVAQNYGANQYDRIWQGIRDVLKVSCTMSVLFGCIVMISAKSLVGLFLSQPSDEILELVQLYFYVNGSQYVILAAMLIYRYSLQGLGNSFAPMISGVMELVMRGVGALVLSHYFGFTGTIFSSPLAWLGALIPVMIIFYVTKSKLSQEFLIPR